MGNVEPQNESAVKIEASNLNIKTTKGELYMNLKEKWIKFIDCIDDKEIEKFLWIFGIRKELPYLQYLTLKQFIELFEVELFNELVNVKGVKIEELALNSKTILAYSEYQDNGSLANILGNGYDFEFDSIIELIEFDIDKFISDCLRKVKNNDRYIS
jgi:hypothetical protein